MSRMIKESLFLSIWLNSHCAWKIIKMAKIKKKGLHRKLELMTIKSLHDWFVFIDKIDRLKV